ncbi:hypothetical protein ACS0TY_034448 [Phlomoides rotata]
MFSILCGSLCILLCMYLSLILTHTSPYVNAQICGAEKWRKPLARFLRQPHFIVWDNVDLVTHEVMGGLKNVYAIGAVQRENIL